MIDSIGPQSNPDFGIIQIPYAGLGFLQNRDMTDPDELRPRDVLAANLVKLMRHRQDDLGTFPQITNAGGGANGTLDRIRRKESATSVDNLAPLASVFGLEAWQLLVPDLDPKAPPQLVRSSLLTEIKALVESAHQYEGKESQDVSGHPVNKPTSGRRGSSLDGVIVAKTGVRDAGSKPQRSQKPRTRRRA